MAYICRQLNSGDNELVLEGGFIVPIPRLGHCSGQQTCKGIFVSIMPSSKRRNE